MVSLKGKDLALIAVTLLFLGALGAVIALAVMYSDLLAQNNNNNNNGEETTTMTLPPMTTVTPATTSTMSPVADVKRRINCFPEQQGSSEVAWTVTEAQCKTRGCTYDPATMGNKFAPTCYMHPKQIGYRVTDVKHNTDPDWYLILTLETLSNATIFDPPISTLRFKARIWNNQHLQIKIDDPKNARYEVPFVSPIYKTPGSDENTADFELTYEMNPFVFRLQRKSTKAILWDTSMGGFVFSNRFLQITTLLPSPNFYGLGEQEHPSLLHSLDYKTWPIFARDQGGLGEGANLYGTHPYYMVLENDGNAHSVFSLTSNAMEYQLLPTPGVIFRTIGGIFDFHYSFGPTPNQVIQQHTKMVGYPFIPPYWSLGFHLSRYGYKDLDDMKAAIERTRAARIPLDVIHADIDHMDARKDFTIDEANWGDMPKYFEDELKNNGLRSIIILDPAVTDNATNYEPWDVLDGNKTYITWENGTAMMGYVWPEGKVGFPDFFLERTKTTWTDLIVRHSKKIPFDGLWIDMNEPANFGTNEEKPFNWPADKEPWSLKCPDSEYNTPPYLTHATYFHNNDGRKATLSDKTLCMEARQNDGKYRHYDVHNLYGWSQSQPTLDALQTAYPGRRGFVLARSTFAGSGVYASHWLGDNLARWSHLHRSIIAMLEMSMFSIPHTGADICGFMETTSVELCLRWMQLGAFYPYSRNHNDNQSPNQDPGALGADVAETSREYLLIRYEMLPYLYTLFYYANLEGQTVARPVFFEFPKDSATWAIDRQFMLGPSIMIVPLLDEGKSDVTGYIPQGFWVAFAEKNWIAVYDLCTKGTEITFPVNGTVILQRGGSIGPTQSAFSIGGNVITSEKTRSHAFNMRAALDCDDYATGSLFWDDGDSIDTVKKGEYLLSEYSAKFENNKLTYVSEVAHQSSKADLTSGLVYATVLFFGRGIPKMAPTAVQVNCKDPANCPTAVCPRYDAAIMSIYCSFMSNGMPLTNDFTLTLTW